ncbi:S8 family serine peptidase [Actinokineospora sp. NPDC004072]
MPTPRRTLPVAAALVLALTATTPAAAEPPRPAPAGAEPAQSATLVTGDRVLLRGSTPVVLPAPGREGIGFAIRKVGDRVHVTPADALRPLAEGRLDRRLFDVTGLIAAGYGDRLPLITTDPVPGAVTTQELGGLGLHAASASAQQLGELWRGVAQGDGKVWLDGVRRASLDRSTAQIGAPQAWAAGLTGAGVTVAVLDTGVDEAHPDLAGKQAGQRNFSDEPDPADGNGHGTHVASTIAGGGAKYRGVAPDARILDGKVLDNGGSGQESWILAGMEWAAEQGADIVNLSLGGGDTPEVDPLEEAVGRLSAEHGTLFVIAAGNSGPAPGSVASPGSADAALTVGAVDRDDSIAPFSSRGSLAGTATIKPDITAPGVGIVAARAGTTGHVAASGTSMASPHVAGAAALLAQKHPDWPGSRLKSVLMASARPTAGATAFDQGAGRVDVPASLEQVLHTDPPSLGMGSQPWPHDDAEPVTKQLTYRNSGAADVTTDLAVEPGAPAGMFTVSPSRITVPAGGTATVAVTADPRVTDQDGAFSSAILAGSLRTPVAIERETERYDVTIKVRGDAGGLPFDLLMIAKDPFNPQFYGDDNGELTVRVPKGEYAVEVFTQDGDRLYEFAHPVFTVTGPGEVVYDTSQTKPVAFAPPREATPHGEVVAYAVQLTADSGFGSIVMGDDVFTAHVGPALPPEQLEATVAASWSGGGSDYYLAHRQHGRAFTGYERRVPQSELATTRTQVDSVQAGQWGERGAIFLEPDSFFGVGLPGDRRPLPLRNTDYRTAGTWIDSVFIYPSKTDETIDTDLYSPARRREAGRDYRLRMNNPIYAPALADDGAVYRFGDILYASIPLFGDSSGNAGYSASEEGQTHLYRNDELIAESPIPGYIDATVPSDPATYRLTTTATREHRTSTRIDASWTFRSEEAPLVEIPISTVRTGAYLSPEGTAKAGTPFLIPVALEGIDGNLSTPRSLSVDVSYDDGQTWKPAAVVANSLAFLHHPPQPTPVSLRIKATDRTGTVAELTIIRAYHLKR